MSLEELEKFGPRVKGLQDVRTDGYSTLARPREQKPFFSLNAEKTQPLRKAKHESSEPIPEEVPLFAILKEEASVYTQDSVHVVIQNQTRVRVTEKRCSYYAIEYKGNRFFIPSKLPAYD